MEALILSCSTGGGHNAAGNAVADELIRRGHHAVMLDPYALVGRPMEYAVSGVYVEIAKKTPSLFGKMYGLSDKFREIPGKSPIYYANLLMGDRLADYLATHRVDVILMPHVFPAQIVAGLRRRGIALPTTVFLATDYTCVPFVEEGDCDYYVTPSPELDAEFVARGIPRARLRPYGIPVKADFARPVPRDQAAKRLGLSPDRRYLLLAGGSMGSGDIPSDVLLLDCWLKTHPDYRLVVVCGSNEDLYRELRWEFRRNPRIILKRRVDQMPDWLSLCDVYLSKPGGLSSTEAAVAEIPLIHINPIPGCESCNIKFFGERGLSIPVGKRRDRLLPALEAALDPVFAARMRAAQRREIPKDAAARICDLCEGNV